MKYKALTLTPPWGTLIALGEKKIETRSWRTDYRGPLLIHQGSNLNPVGGDRGLLETCGTQPFFDALYPIAPDHDRYCDRNLIAERLPRGAIVAVCELVDIQPIADGALGYGLLDTERDLAYTWDVTDQERAFGDYSAGRYAWLLSDIRALPEPIPARGLPGLWTWEGELEL